MMVFDPAGFYWGDDAGRQLMVWPEAFAGRQSAEVIVDNFGLGPETDIVALELRRCGTALSDCALSLIVSKTGTTGLWNYSVIWTGPGGAPIFSYAAPEAFVWSWGTGPFALRAESEDNGGFRFLINNQVVIQREVATVPLSPANIGLWTNVTSGGVEITPVYESATRILDICINGISFCDQFVCAPATGPTAFTDDFERADGPLGTPWAQFPVRPLGWSALLPFTIRSGAAQSGATSGGPSGVYVTDPVPGDQSAEVVVTNFAVTLSGDISREVGVVTRYDPTSATFSGVNASIARNGSTADVYLTRYDPYVDGPLVNIPIPAEPFTLRLDSVGTQHTVTINGVTVLEADDDDLGGAVVGDYVGMFLWFSRTGATLDDSVRIDSFANASAGFCDDFERADGPIGADWELPPVPIESPSYAEELPDIVGGNVLGPPQSAAPGVQSGSARWATPVGEGDQFIEAVVGGLKPPAGAGSSSGRVWLFCQMSETTGARTAAYVFQQRNTTTTMNFGKELNTYDSAGQLWHLAWNQYTDEAVPSDDPTHTIRFESDADGAMRFYLDGVLIGSTVGEGEDGGPVTGGYVGFALTTEGPVVNRPWIESVCAGGPGGAEVVCDDLAPEWVLPPPNNTLEVTEALELMRLDDVGAFCAPEDPASTAIETGAAQWATAMPGSQYIELCITGLSLPAEGRDGTVYMFCQGNADNPAREELAVTWGDSPASYLTLLSYSRDAAGIASASTTFLHETPWASYDEDVAICVRFEVGLDRVHRVYYGLGMDGASMLVSEGTNLFANAGPFVGFRMHWSADSVDSPPPYVLWACGGLFGGGVPPEEVVALRRGYQGTATIPATQEA